MTIAEAQKRWHISDNALLKYLRGGVIPKITVIDNVIDIPEIKRPLCVSPSTKRSAENIFIYIIKACNEGYYINSKLMNSMDVSDSEFSSCIDELIEKKLLIKTSDYIDNSSNIGLILSVDGCNYFKQCQTKKNYEKVLKTLDLGFTLISQVVFPVIFQ